MLGRDDVPPRGTRAERSNAKRVRAGTRGAEGGAPTASPAGRGSMPRSEGRLVLRGSANLFGSLGRALRLQLLHPPPDELALQAREVVDEEDPLGVIDLVLERDGQEPFAHDLDLLAFPIERLDPDLRRALDLLGLAGDGEAALR